MPHTQRSPLICFSEQLLHLKLYVEMILLIAVRIK